VVAPRLGPVIEPPPSLWVLTGMSGAGKATALAALAGAGVDCTDNLPVGLLGEMAMLPRRRPAVAVIDARQGEAVQGAVIPAGTRILFLDARDEVLVRRQADSTVPHPCASAGSGRAAVDAERELLGDLRAEAEAVVDTSELGRRELAQAVLDVVRPGEGVAPDQLVCTVSSFGFKYGPQLDADWVVDTRFLINPFWEPELRPLTGLDDLVHEYVMANEDARELVDRLAALLGWMAGRATARGRTRVHVAVGCTGGRHRSVVVANALAEQLRGGGLAVVLRHRDVLRPDPR